MNKKDININFDLLKEQRDHLLGHVWHDNNQPPQPIDEELAWGIIYLMDALLDNNEAEKNTIYR